MRSGKTTAALALLLALATGCGSRPLQTSAPQAAQAPSLPPAQMVALIPPVPPAMPVTRRPVKLDTTAPPETNTETASEQPLKPSKHHSKPAETAQETAKPAAQGSSPPAGQVASAQPSEMSKIGQLSTANDSSDTADRHEMSGKIDNTENGLNAIKRPLSADEQKTVALIRSYITRARDALKADDLDGAKILRDKAQQLLEELTKQ